FRHVAPARRPLLEHGDRVPVDPEQVLAQIAQQLEAPRVSPRLDPGQNVGPGGCLGLEIPADHRGELIERLQNREVQLTKEIGRKHQTTVPVDYERFHASPPKASRSAGGLSRLIVWPGLACPYPNPGPRHGLASQS